MFGNFQVYRWNSKEDIGNKVFSIMISKRSGLLYFSPNQITFAKLGLGYIIQGTKNASFIWVLYLALKPRFGISELFGKRYQRKSFIIHWFPSILEIYFIKILNHSYLSNSGFQGTKGKPLWNILSKWGSVLQIQEVIVVRGLKLLNNGFPLGLHMG